VRAGTQDVPFSRNAHPPLRDRRTVGKGRVREVYRAQDTKLERSVAIKVLGVQFAHVQLGLGDGEQAEENLEAAMAEPPFTRSWYFSWLKVDPIWNPLRDDSRFQNVLRA
jgi:serine/threonine protein kinase